MEDLIAEFRRRARRLSYQAYGVFGAIVLVIVAGGFFLVYANEVSERGLSTATGQLDELSVDILARLTSIENGVRGTADTVGQFVKIHEEFSAMIEGASLLGQGYVDSVENLRQKHLLTLDELEVLGDGALQEIESAASEWVQAVLEQLRIDVKSSSKAALGEAIDVCNKAVRSSVVPGTFVNPMAEKCVSTLKKSEANNIELVSLNPASIVRLDLGVDLLRPLTPEKIEAYRVILDQDMGSVLSGWQSTAESNSDMIVALGGFKPDFEKLVFANAQLERNYATFAEAVAQFEDAQSSIESQDWFSFTKASVLRLGVIVLMIFLVQILVNLFRYSTRLAAFYNARADALSLLQATGGNLSVSETSVLIGALSPDSLDFGKQPRSPVGQGAEIAKALTLQAVRRQ